MEPKNHVLHVRRYLTPHGITISLGKKSYDINYPVKIWQQFPSVYHHQFADTVAHAMTVHLSFMNFKDDQQILYHFPPPAIEPLIFKGLMYSLPEDAQAVKKFKTSDYIKLLFNSYHRIKFASRPRYERFKNVNRNNKKKALIPFTFGKDSLLSFALCRELGIDPVLIFFREPRCPYENRQKVILNRRFFKKFGKTVTFFPLSTGWLREVSEKGPWWGWDLLLTQYNLLMIPYLFAHRAKYLFWSHEQSCNITFTDPEGYVINPVFEQNHQWLLNMNSSFTTLGCNTMLTSLIEPLHDLLIMYILHHRYPDVGRFQNSCFGDEPEAKNRRWCGMCPKCARMYIFSKAIGLDPKKIGFTKNMLVSEKKHLFSLFGCTSSDSSYDASGIGRDEQLLSFYLAYKRGTNGPLLQEFRKKYLGEVEKRKNELFNTFFVINPSQTIPSDLKSKVIKIYEEELKSLKKSLSIK